MKNLLLLFTAIILINNAYAQISFEKGYFINNSNQRIDCLIKNIDWNNNPVDFEYKLSENATSQLVGINNIKEFGISGVSKYSKHVVQIDRSTDIVNELNDDRNPIFKKEQLLLNVLIEGKASLYVYVSSKLIRYFYSIENSDVEQFVYKRYVTSDNKVGENNHYRQQILNDLKCSTITLNEVKNTGYNKKSLIKIFAKYNECSNSSFTNYEEKKDVERKVFNLSLKTRINKSSLSIYNSTNSISFDFDSKIGFSIGTEFEYILPFNKNKWALFFEPTYHYFNSEKTDEVDYVSGGVLNIAADYSSIEFPIGLRHYFFINNDSKIFINASIIYELLINSSILFKRDDNSILNSLDINPGYTSAFGVGYKQDDRYSIELRFQNKNLLGGYSFWNSDYKVVSIIFGYTLFKR